MKTPDRENIYTFNLLFSGQLIINQDLGMNRQLHQGGPDHDMVHQDQVGILINLLHMLRLDHVQTQIIQVREHPKDHFYHSCLGRGYPEPYHNPNGWPPGPGWQDSYGGNPGGFGRRTSPSHPGGPPGGRWDDKADWNDPG